MSESSQRYIHVHHFKNTKLFGAWFNDPSRAGKKVRLFFGSHLTAYLAARAQDRAALKYKPYALDPRSIKLNFREKDYDADQKLREMLTCEEFGELLRKESRPKYTKMEPTRCLRKFLAHERARGNIPPAVPATEEIISLRQYLKEVIRKRQQLDEDMEDPVPDSESSDDDPESSDEEMEDPFPTAKQKKHALRRSEGKRMVVFTGPRTRGSPVAGSSECKPVVIAPAPLVWGRKRPRSKRQEDKTYNQHESKVPKIRDSTDCENSLEPVVPPTNPEGLPSSPAVENTKSPEPGNEAGGLPQSPDQLQFRVKWHYKMHKLQTTSRTSAAEIETLPGAENCTKTTTPEPAAAAGPECEGGGLGPQSTTSSTVPEFPKLQFRSKWHYKVHEIQKPQTTTTTTTTTAEPSPENVEGVLPYLQALALTVVSQAGN